MYQALYRKWRPNTFADVVGQSHITTTLMNEIITGRHSHAYLFTGSRGTGKTTCAKIFAKAVNCEHPVNGDPCNECDTCKGIDSGSIMDVIEIDAASNNGVDSIRDIRDEANFTPVNSKYRVYIIDEVHMLSTGAFNALLKTLEEPPAHVKFVLATTEVHKLPATILSRCQRFDFKRLTPEDISGRLEYVASQENLNLDSEAAMLIARLADGALRDALSILDQCIGHGSDITLATVNEVVGLAGKDYLFDLSNSIIDKNSAAALEKINDLHNRSCDMERLCNELINHFRNLMVAKAVNDPHNLIVCSDSELSAYMEMTAKCSMSDILNILDVLGDALSNLRKGLNRRVEMEMAIIRLCSTTAPIVNTSPSVARPVAKSVDKPATSPVQQTAAAAPIEKPQIKQEPVEPPKHISQSEPLSNGQVPTDVWNAVIREAVSNDKPLIGTMNSSTAVKNGAQLIISTDNPLLKNFLGQEMHRQIIYNAIYSVMGEYLKPVIDNGNVQTAPETVPFPNDADDPLEAFINSLKNSDINLSIEE